MRRIIANAGRTSGDENRFLLHQLYTRFTPFPLAHNFQKEAMFYRF